MNHNSPQISLDTLIAASPLLGHKLEDRSSIRDAQDTALVQKWQESSSTRLSNFEQQQLFCVAPLDLLVSEVEGRKQFHLLELNGTGIGGLTNMSHFAVNAILDGMNQMAAQQLDQSATPLVIIASSGKESIENPRLNKLIYEKLLYAEAFRRGFADQGRETTICTMPGLVKDPSLMTDARPVVVVGYIKEFLDELKVTSDGRLALFGRTVTGAVNDRFVMNVLNQFDGLVDLNQLATMNRCHLAGADKGVAYSLLNDYLVENPIPYFPDRVHHEIATDRSQLIATVLEWGRQGRTAVIKPQGTGLGHGIEFFTTDDSQADVLRKVDRSIRITEEYYQVSGGAFPYTVCEFVDACTVPDRRHPLFGHKYELRVAVYRDGMYLKAFPSIIKVACEPVGPNRSEPTGLINNITASCMKTEAKGTDFMFPLANRQTLATFGLDEEHIIAVCRGATGYVRYVLDQVQDNPTRLGLPVNSAANFVWSNHSSASMHLGGIGYVV